MAVPYVFVAGTTIEPDQVNDNFSYVENLADGGLLVDGTNAMLAPLKLATGVLATPSLTFDGDLNTGIYRSGADTFVFVAGGVAQATVSTSGLSVSSPWAIGSGGTGATTAPAARTALGVGTGDSPEFLAINIGAAADTTMARVSAGVVSIEGVTVAMLGLTDQVITGGARVTPLDLGTISSGTTTPDPGDRPMQYATVTGNFTLAPGSNNGTYTLDITISGGSVSAITVSGWTKVTGGFTYTNGHKFRCYCSVGSAGSLLQIVALQ